MKKRIENLSLEYTRRAFIHKASTAGVMMAIGGPLNLFAEPDGDVLFQSPYLRFRVAVSRPAFSALNIDWSGKSNFTRSPVIESDVNNASFRTKHDRKTINYYPSRQKQDKSPAWKLTLGEKEITLTSNYTEDNRHFELLINQHLNHATVLGLMKEKNKVCFPCLIHFPDMGTLRVSCDAKDAYLFFDAKRYVEPHFVKIKFPHADGVQKITYHLEVVAIHPQLNELDSDAEYDGFRINFINIFQMNPQLQVLANNSSSDPCAFTLYMYSEAAKFTPPLAEGLTAMMLLKQTLDKYLAGFKGYGMTGFQMFGVTESNPGDQAIVSDFLDTYPSLLMAVCDYVMHTKDMAWLNKNYEKILTWIEKMLNFDIDNDGLLEYPLSGNSGSWGNMGKVKARPSNWWDTIGFGHKDAYSNALAYKAFTGLAAITEMTGKSEDAKKFAACADKLKASYCLTFFNKETGVLAGWKSADGELHDYYFTFVNSVAITYGLVEKEIANQLMDRLLEKMKAVNYTDFSLGIPGNLIPVKRADYVHKDKRWGGGEKEDGSDGFQIYENGGATACYSYFTIRALQDLGRHDEADAILRPILKSITDAGFSGKCENGMTRDWKTWRGECWGYEGFLVDNYLVLLSVLTQKRFKN